LESELNDLLKWELRSRGKGTQKDELKRERLTRYLISLGNVKAESKVLSIGCGTGYYELTIRKYANHLFCLDISKKMLHICRIRGIRNLVRGSSLCLPLKSDIFDCVYALSISSVAGASASEYSRAKTVHEMKRVAIKGGKIVAGDPTTLWKQITGLLRHGNPNSDRFGVSPDEVKRSYKQNDLRFLKLLLLPPIPYVILRRIEYPIIDRVASRLLLSRLGPYAFVSGVK
jgi:SAM-dependent methyltransferase